MANPASDTVNVLVWVVATYCFESPIIVVNWLAKLETSDCVVVNAVY